MLVLVRAVAYSPFARCGSRPRQSVPKHQSTEPEVGEPEDRNQFSNLWESRIRVASVRATGTRFEASERRRVVCSSPKLPPKIFAQPSQVRPSSAIFGRFGPLRQRAAPSTVEMLCVPFGLMTSFAVRAKRSVSGSTTLLTTFEWMRWM